MKPPSSTTMKNIYQLGFVAIASLQVFSINPSLAQTSNIIPDNTLGAESSQKTENFQGLSVEAITGGAQRGINLFHSFREFNVSEGRAAYFLSPNAEIQNILTRVTGNNPSEILGTLGTIGNSQPNLFLINPNGIVFGERSSLDLQGSFVGTTADSIKLKDGTFFSTSNNQEKPLLTISVPIGLQFGTNPGKITVQGDGRGTRLTLELIDTLTGLRVGGNQTLALVGGELKLEGATLKTDGGRIELGSVAGSSSINLNAIAKGWSLGYEEVSNFGNIQLSEQATVDVSGVGSGDIKVQGRRVSLTGGSGLDASTLRTRSGGTLNVNASELLELTGTSQDGQIQSGLFAIVYSGNKNTRGGNIIINTKGLLVRDGAQIQAVNQPLSEGSPGNLQVKASGYINLIGESELFSSGLFTQSQGLGNGSELNIETKNLSVWDGAQVSASTLSQGLAGKLTVIAENIDLSGTSAAGSQFASGLFVQAQGSGNGGELEIFSEQLVVSDGARVSVDSALEDVGNAGILKIDTGKLIIQNSGQVTAGTVGKGQGGILSIKASELVKLTGERSLLTTQTLGNGKGGDLLVDTKKLIIENGGQISTGTFGKGRGGNLIVTAKDLIQLSDSPSGLFSQSQGFGTAGNLNVKTGQLIIQDEARISASSSDKGNGGDIQLKADSLSITNNAGITSLSLGEGNAGNIIINLDRVLNAESGRINTSAQTSTGGNINITAQNIRLLGNSDISTNVFSGSGGGGNINLTANTIIALDDSDIVSFARDGKGGDITFNTAGFFSKPLYRPSSPTTDVNARTLDGNNQVDVNASGAVSGVISGVPDITFIDENLADLPDNQINTDSLIANSCISRSNKPQENSFIITGTGGLRNRPGDELISQYSTGEVRNVEPKSRTWKKGDRIIEPTGVYKLSDGRILLSRECGQG